jgi:hypothetical protein
VGLISWTIGSRLIEPVLDLVTNPFTHQTLTIDVYVFGVLGIVSIVVGSIVGAFLALRVYHWTRAANRAMQRLGWDRSKRVGRIEVRDKTFENQDVNLDGRTWIGCKFGDCNIIMEYGDFDVISCTFERCRLSARGGAVGILKLAKGFFPQIPLIESSGTSNSVLDEQTTAVLVRLAKSDYRHILRDQLNYIWKDVDKEWWSPRLQIWKNLSPALKKLLIAYQPEYDALEDFANALDQFSDNENKADSDALKTLCKNRFERLKELKLVY